MTGTADSLHQRVGTKSTHGKASTSGSTVVSSNGTRLRDKGLTKRVPLMKITV